MALEITVTDKATHAATTVQGQEVTLSALSVVQLPIAHTQIKSLARKGADLVITTADGQVIVVHGFFVDGQTGHSDLVFQDEDGGLWLTDSNDLSSLPDGSSIDPTAANGGAGSFTQVDSLDALLGGDVTGATDGEISWIPIALAAAGFATALATSGSGDNPGPHKPGKDDPKAPSVDPIKVNDDGSITITGHTKPGNIVTITFPDGSTQTMTALDDGTYSFTSAPHQPGGDVIITVTDPITGITSPPTDIPYSTDPSLPGAPGVNEPRQNADGTLTVTGKDGKQGDIITVTFPDGTTKTGIVGPDGTYSITSDTPQTSGDVKIKVTDSSGHSSGETDIYFTDTVPPIAPGVDKITDNGDGTLTLTGTGEAGSKVTVTFPDGKTATGTVNSDGTWKVISPAGEATDKGNITITQTDQAGNTSESITIPYDPNAKVQAPGMGEILANPNGTITVTGTGKSGDTVTVKFPDGTSKSAIVDPTGHYTVTSDTPQTTGTVSATESDSSGNTSSATTSTYTDLTPPVAPGVNVTTNPDKTITVSGTGEPGSTITVAFPDHTTKTFTVGSDGKYSVTSDTAQPKGSVVVTDTDQAKNTSDPTTVPYDPNAPVSVPGINTPTQNPDGTITVTGTGTPGDTVKVVWPDGSSKTGTVDASGHYNITSDTPQDSGTLTVTQSDGSNTSAPVYYHYTDITAPLAPIMTVTHNSDGSLNVTGTGEPGTTVTIHWSDGTSATATVDATGHWTSKSAASQPDGLLWAVDTDKVGNTSSPTTYQIKGGVVSPNIDQPTQNPDGTVTVTGTGKAGDAITVTWPDGSTQTGTIDSSGHYKVTSTAPVSTGAITVTDTTVGIASQYNYKDVTAPLAPSMNVIHNDDGSLSVTGTGEQGTTVTIYWSDGTSSTATVDATGHWTAKSAASQPDGTIMAVDTDKVGNISPPTTYQIKSGVVSPNIDLPTQNPDGTVTVTGTGKAGDAIKITWPDGSTQTGTIDSSGHYKVTSSAPVSTGAITVTDTTVGIASTYNYKDVTAPLAPLFDMTANSDGSLSVTGTGEPGTTVTIYWSDGTSATATVDATGHWTAKSAASQPDGTIIAIDIDKVGNVSQPTTYQIKGGLFATIHSPITQDVTNGGVITVTGMTKPGSTVVVTFPDGTSATATVDANGYYSATSSVLEGSGKISVTATNGGQTVTTVTTYTDITPPLAPHATLVHNTADDSVSLTGSGGEPNSTIKITWPDGSTQTATVGTDGKWTATSPGHQPDGNVTLVDIDKAGNASGAYTILYDHTKVLQPPEITDVTQNADGTLTVTILGVPNGNATVTFPDKTSKLVTLDANGIGHISSDKWQTSGDISATQTQGNNTSNPASEAWVDHTLPVAPTISGVSLDATGHEVVTGTAEPGTTVTVTWPDNTSGTFVVGLDGKYTVTSPGAESLNSVIVVKATDVAGNTGPSATWFPGPRVDSAIENADGTVTVSGTAGAAVGSALVTVYFPDGTSNSVTANSDGSYSVSSLGVVSIGATGMVDVTQTDPASHLSGHTSAVIVWDNTIVVSDMLNADTHQTLVNAGVGDWLTNNGHVTISGTLKTALASGQTLQISFDNGSHWDTVTNSTASMSWVFDKTLSGDNTYMVELRIVDSSSKPLHTAAVTLELDTTKPTEAIHLDSPPADLSSITGTVGALADGTTNGVTKEFVKISLDGGQTWVGTATVKADGTWSYTPDTSKLTPGATYNVEAAVFDAAGNQGTTTPPIPVPWYPNTPIANIQEISPDNAIVDGTAVVFGSATDFVTNTGKLTTIGGSLYSGDSKSPGLPSGESVQLIIDGGAPITVTVAPGDTSWTYNFPSGSTGLSEGQHTFKVQIVDGSNSVVASGSQTVVIDLTPPAETLTFASQDTFNNAPVIVTVTAGTALADGTKLSNGVSAETVQFSTDGINWVNAHSIGGNQWSANLPLATGDYTVQARVVDAAGNIETGTLPTQTIHVVSNPTITIGSMSPDLAVMNADGTTVSYGSTSDFITSDQTGNVTFSGKVQLASGQSMQVSIDGGAFQAVTPTSGTWTYTTTGTLAQGNHTVKAQVIDASNQVVGSTSQQVLIDNTAPSETSTFTTAQGLPVANDGTITVSAPDGKVTLSGTIAGGPLGIPTDGAANEAMQVSVDGGKTWTTLTDVGYGASSWAHTFSLANGTYQVETRVVDQAGNEGTASTPVTLTVTGYVNPTSIGIFIDSITPTDTGKYVKTGVENADLIYLSNDKNVTVSGHMGQVLSSGEYVQVTLIDSNDVAKTYNSNDPLYSKLFTFSTATGTNVPTWTFKMPSQADENYTLVAKVVTQATNDTVYTATDTLVIDTVPPTAVPALKDIKTDTGMSGTDLITQNFQPTLEGTLDMPLATDPLSKTTGGLAGASTESLIVTLTGTDAMSNTSIVSGTATITSADGKNWSFSIPEALRDDSYTVTLQVVDAAGNKGTAVTLAKPVVIDHAPPVAQFSLINGAWYNGTADTTGKIFQGTATNDTNFTLTGNLNQALESGSKPGVSKEYVELSFDGGSTWYLATTTTTGTTWTLDTKTAVNAVTGQVGIALTDKTYTVDMRIADVAGNVTGNTSTTLTVNSKIVFGTHTTIDSINPDTGTPNDFITQAGFVIPMGQPNAGKIMVSGSVVDLNTNAKTTLTGGNEVVEWNIFMTDPITGANTGISISGGWTTGNVATVTGSSWTADMTAYLGKVSPGSYIIETQVYDKDLGAVISQTPDPKTVVLAAPPSEVVTFGKVEYDPSGTPWITDGSNGQPTKIDGTVSTALNTNEKLVVTMLDSSNHAVAGAVTWTDATNWVFTTSTALTDGQYTLKAQIQNAAAGLNGPTYPSSGTQDLTVQSIKIISDPSADSSFAISPDTDVPMGGTAADYGTLHDRITSTVVNTANPSGPNLTTPQQITLSGTTDKTNPNDGSNIQVSFDGGTHWANATWTGDTWSYTTTAADKAGYTGEGIYNNVEARYVSKTSAPGTVVHAPSAIIVDNTRPTETLTINDHLNAATTPLNWSAGNLSGSKISGTIDGQLLGKDGSVVTAEQLQISLDGGSTWTDVLTHGTISATKNAGGTYDWTYTVPTGTYDPLVNKMAEVRVADKAGNVSDSTHMATQSIAVVPTSVVTLALNPASDDGKLGDNATSIATPVIDGTVNVNATDSPAIQSGYVKATLFVDTNGNGKYDPGTDRILASNVQVDTTGHFSTSIGSLPVGQTTISVVLDNQGALQTAPEGSYALTITSQTVTGPITAGTNASETYTVTGNGLSSSIGPNGLAAQGIFAEFGYAMSKIGDFNGDGYTDYLVTAPHDAGNHLGAPGSSVEYIVLGGPNGLPNISNLDTPSSQVIKISGATNVTNDMGLQGFTVTNIGDFNGDGKDDFAIASNLDDSVAVIYGGAFKGGQSINLANLTASQGFVVKSATGISFFGNSVAGVDMNGDGYSDLVIGNGFSTTGNSGQMYVVYGHPGNTQGTVTLTNNTTMTGTAANGYTVVTGNTGLGTNMQNIGDVNGDGWADFIVTAPGVSGSNGPVTPSAAYVLYGGPGGLLNGSNTAITLPATLSASQGYKVTDSLGEALGGGVAQQGTHYITYTGSGGVANQQSFQLTNAEYAQYHSVGQLGNINGNGQNYYAVGTPGAINGFLNNGIVEGAGAVYVFGNGSTGAGITTPTWNGSTFTGLSGIMSTGGFVIYDSAFANASKTVNGIQNASDLGFSVSSVGDVNGDGITDFMIGAPLANQGKGAVFLVFGAAGGLTGQSSGVVDLETLLAAGVGKPFGTPGTAVEYVGSQTGGFGYHNGSGVGTDVTGGDFSGSGINGYSYSAPGQDTAGGVGTGVSWVYNGTTVNLSQGYSNADGQFYYAGVQGAGYTMSNLVNHIATGAGNNDWVHGIGATNTAGIDSVNGGAGSDFIGIVGNNFNINGGEGWNTLVFEKSSMQPLNLASVGLKLQNISEFDLGNTLHSTAADPQSKFSATGYNELDLRLSDVVSLHHGTSVNSVNTGANNGLMTILGDNTDTVKLVDGVNPANWGITGPAVTLTVSSGAQVAFNHYHDAAMGNNTMYDVLIQQGVKVIG